VAFRGTFDHTLDAKNRLTVPSKFRKALSSGVVVARGIEACVALWLPADFETWSEEMVGAMGRLTTQGRQFRRVISASAFETELDAANRVTLPARLIEHAGLRKDVVIVGNEECLEVWDRKAWSEYDASISPQIPDLTDSIGPAA